MRGTLCITLPSDGSLHPFLIHVRRRDLVPLLAAGLGAKGLRAGNEDLTNLEQWFRADSDARKRARASSLRRIRHLDESIHAWVQVHPQPQTAEGPLSGIPFGVKDVIETENLVTEFGSPIYKGRRGTGDAVIVGASKVWVPSSLARRKQQRLRIRRPARHAIRATSPTHRAGVPVGLPRR